MAAPGSDQEFQALLAGLQTTGGQQYAAGLQDVAETHQYLDAIDRRLGRPVDYEATLPRRALSLQGALAGSIVVSRATAITALGATFLIGVSIGLLLARRPARRVTAQPPPGW